MTSDRLLIELLKLSLRPILSLSPDTFTDRYSCSSLGVVTVTDVLPDGVYTTLTAALLSIDVMLVALTPYLTFGEAAKHTAPSPIAIIAERMIFFML